MLEQYVPKHVVVYCSVSRDCCVVLLFRIVKIKYIETVLTLGVVKSPVEVLITSSRYIPVTIYWVEAGCVLCVRVNVV
jgi:hypothetical protein